MPPHPSTMRPGGSTTQQAKREQRPWSEQVLSNPRRFVHDGENVLMGAKAICRYMKISAIKTLGHWVDSYGFPAIKTPEGKWMTTTTAIDQWIWLAAELEAAKRSRNRTRDLALYKASHATGQAEGLVETRTKPPMYTSSHLERAETYGHDPQDVIVQSAARKLANGRI